MNWKTFNELSTQEKINHTKSDGVKVSVEWRVNDNSRGPKVFEKWPDCYYHFEGDESTDTEAIIWVNAEFSPSNALDAIVDSNSPIIEVLQDNRNND